MSEHEMDEPFDGNSHGICGFDGDLLSAWLDGELDGNEDLQVREHLADCPGCSRKVESLRYVNNQFARVLSEPSAIRKAGNRLAPVITGRSSIHLSPSRADKHFNTESRFPARLLATLAIAFVGGLFGFLVLSGGPRADDGITVDSERLQVAMTRVAEPLGRMVSTNDAIRSQQAELARTMQQELRLLNLMVRSLPENEESLAVRAEIGDLLEKARLFGVEIRGESLE
jgi:Putative zinc-finger